MTPDSQLGAIRHAAAHALAWLVFGNAVGLLLSILLLFPNIHLGELTYGRWAPVHLNAQLYGWTALPLVAWLFSIYETNHSKASVWAVPSVWAWSGALALGCISWLTGTSSGKVFLDWKNGALWVFIAALILLWTVLAISWKQHLEPWTRRRRWFSGIGIAALMMVPVSMIIAASPSVYPPVDHTTGGPTGSSLLGSTLIVIGMMLILPIMAGLERHQSGSRFTWIFFVICLAVFVITEAVGGSHFEFWQIGAMLCLVPWAFLIPQHWKTFSWPEGTAAWKNSALCWWVLLVTSGVTMYFPTLLDHLKFTQGLVAHSHLAMAGFTTSFCALLLVTVSGKKIGSRRTILIWNGAAFAMILILAWMGWREGNESSWMTSHPTWRNTGLLLRTCCGAIMLSTSATWLFQWTRK